ncbi:pyridoxal phosphate biosynthetic protein PdxJ [Burkholderia vietnamiensis]|uniref:pyridoxal phosphate biosynthetic protein PdxJ n=1 Tax=Burkholderia vietnamiensis TaxID=60552 RepID=UPI00264DC648|nr:pyridoxal phosphate biosynthetic protein PdxJ [Burkholderia vietnamiensis]MDN8043969.1 pyridoxal phosphate biosynthetic protein PdxJ [Burkholderia vietnamiensis]HDR9134968.1 pyridoxal phosphate biosynthetic protein PdxJ [Burkholderia vietnamiensis]
MDDRTRQLDLTAPIQTGNTKAAAAAAGATSADLWMTPYEALRYDPRDNVRPVDPQWVKELTALMMQNGYDKGSPLHCYARKVDGKDYFYVYKGQHRYLAAGAAIKAGKDLGKIPIVVRDSRDVKRSEMVVDGYVSNVSKASSPLDLAMSIAELRDIHGFDTKTICARLNISEQSIRDAALLEKAPAELHDLVRSGAIAGTLAIEEIRAHGGDKALERIQSGLSKVKEAGKAKVTKKHLTGDTKASEPAAPKTAKINDARAKQLFQALQSVLRDDGFGKLAPATIDAVHKALMPLNDLLDAKPTGKFWPVTEPDENGCCQPVDTLRGPERTDRIKGALAHIRIAQPAPGAWIYAIEYNTGTSFASDPLRVSPQSRAVWTRVQAIRSGAARLIDTIKSPVHGQTKAEQTAFKRIRAWAQELVDMADPDTTAEFSTATTKGERPDLTDVLTAIEHKRRISSNKALLDAAFPTHKAKPGLEPAAAWPFPTGGAK